MRSPKQNFAVPDIAELRDELRRVGELLGFLVNAAREGEVGSYTLKQFRTRHKLSESQYHKLRRQRRGPRVMSVGSCGVRISREADRDWITERETEAVAAKEADSTQAKPSPRGAPRATPSRSSSSHRALDQALKGHE
jgi:hypothetical protein